MRGAVIWLGALSFLAASAFPGALAAKPAPTNSDAVELCGNGGDGDIDVGIDACTKAIEGSPPAPQRAKLLFHRGNAYVFKEQYEAAIKDYNLAIELSDDASVPGFWGLCRAYRLKLNYDVAIGYCDAAIKLNPELGKLYAERGAAH